MRWSDYCTPNEVQTIYSTKAYSRDNSSANYYWCAKTAKRGKSKLKSAQIC